VVVVVVLAGVGGRAAARCWAEWLWRRVAEVGEGCAPAAFSGSGREPGGGAAGVVVLPGVVDGEDALVADGEQAGDPQGERVRPVRRHQPRAMLVVAVSLMVALARSALVRRR